MMMPIAVGLFERHPPGILRHRLRHRRRRGKQDPGLRIALGYGTRRRALAAPLVGAVLGLSPGPLGPLTRRAWVLLMRRWRRHRRAHPHPAWHQGLSGSPAAH